MAKGKLTWDDLHDNEDFQRRYESDGTFREICEKYPDMVLGALNGSRSKAIRLQCLTCTNHKPIWVRKCQIPFGCFLWMYRMGKGKDDPMSFTPDGDWDGQGEDDDE